MSHLNANSILPLIADESVTSVRLPPESVVQPVTAASLLRDAGAVALVLGLVAIGCALPFCG